MNVTHQKFSRNIPVTLKNQRTKVIAIKDINDEIPMNLTKVNIKPLNQENLSELNKNLDIPTPAYDRDNIGIGIVHIGPGAFHRSHQAFHTENAIQASGGDWAICGVSLRQSDHLDVLAMQDNLYTLATLDKHINYRIIGSIKEFLNKEKHADKIIARMTAITTKLVTLTITEKGYCLDANGTLDLTHPDIKSDLATPQNPASAIGLIVETLKQRKRNNIPAYNVLSCDNVSGNGDKLRNAVLGYAEQVDPSLKEWIFRNVAFPNSMVDCITPKTEEYTIDRVRNATHLHDKWPIQREAFSQWVIQNNWQGDRPDWHKVGVIFTDDVEGFENAKLRLLNCLHSTLAYAGSLAGFETVYDATNNKGLYEFITKLAENEIIGSFIPPQELEVRTYAQDIVQRFLNPEIRHLLSQIAFDGSQKIQMRLLPIIEDNLKLGRSTNLLCLSLACWFEFIATALKCGEEINDPMANDFSKISDLQSDNPQEVIAAFLNIELIFGTNFKENKQITKQLISSLKAIRKGGITDLQSVIREVG